MNDATKRTTLIIVVVVAAIVAIWQGISFFKAPTVEVVGKPIGNYSPSHTGKQEMLKMGQDQAK